MLLYLILGVKKLNTRFYISFAFFFLETYNDYLWVLLSFKEFYQKKNILDPNFMGTNYEKTLIHGLQNIMLSIKHVVCF